MSIFETSQPLVPPADLVIGPAVDPAVDPAVAAPVAVAAELPVATPAKPRKWIAPFRHHANATVCGLILLLIILLTLGGAMGISLRNPSSTASPAAQRTRFLIELALLLEFCFNLPLGLLFEWLTERFAWQNRVAPVLIAIACAGICALIEHAHATLGDYWSSALFWGIAGAAVFCCHWFPLVLSKPPAEASPPA